PIPQPRFGTHDLSPPDCRKTDRGLRMTLYGRRVTVSEGAEISPPAAIRTRHAGGRSGHLALLPGIAQGLSRRPLSSAPFLLAGRAAPGYVGQGCAGLRTRAAEGFDGKRARTLFDR